MPRFTIKRLLAAVALIAVGCGMLGAIRYVSAPFISLAIWIAAGAVIGAGILTPFHRMRLGIATGIVAGFAVLAGMLLTKQ
jgi:hypothetical protein